MIRQPWLLLAGMLAAATLAFPQSGGPIVSGITPSSAPAGSPDQTVTVFGQFPVGSGLTVQWFVPGTESETNLAIVTSTPTSIVVTVPANLLTQPETAEIYVDENYYSFANFTVTAPGPSLTSLSPGAAPAGSPTFTLTVNGANIPASPAPSVVWNGTVLATTYVNSGQLTATVPASLLTSPGIVVVSLNTQPPPNSLNFVITQLPLTLSSISPTSIVAGSPGFNLTVSGSGFTSATVVTWNGSALGTTFVSSSQLTAAVLSSLIATVGTASVSVAAPGETSPSPLPFTINTNLTITSISPMSATAGGPAFTLTVNGTGFSANTVLYWNSTALTATVVNAGQLTATVPANLIAQAGMASIMAQNGSQVSNSFTFTISPPALTLTSLSPNTATAGGGEFTLIANGSGYSNSTVVTWNGTPLVSGFLSTTQVAAVVPASLIATQGTASVGVSTPGQTSPAPLPFVIAGTFAISSLAPASGTAGGPAFTLSINGGGFNSNTVVYWNSTVLPLTAVTSGQIMATVAASLIAQPGSASITAQNGTQISNPATFTINPPLTLTSISPNTAIAGGAAFTLTANGSAFTSGTVITWNGSPLATTFVSASQLTTTVPASLIATAGMASVGVSATGQTSPTALPFTISPILTITSLSPASTIASGPAFTLTVNGAGFNSTTTVYWNSTALASTTVNAGQIMAAVPANLISQPGSASITAQNGTQISNALTFTVTSPALTLTSISPNTAVAGGPAFTLTLNGSGFNSTTIAYWNSTALASSVVNSGQITAMVPASLIAQTGSASITAQNGTQISNALTFTVTAPALTLTSISPNTALAGGPAFTLTLNGTGFNSTTIAYWNSTALASTAVNSGQITATVPANLIAQSGSASITAQSGTLMSNALPFTITSPAFTLTSISPNTAVAGGPAFTLTANGSGFSSTTVVTWNGSPLSTTFVSASQLTASVAANLIATVGTASVGVLASGLTSPPALPFTITSSLTITSLSPTSVTAGGPAFTLTVNGTGFNSGTIVYWNSTALGSTEVNSGQFTATVPANLTAQPGSASITAQNGTLVSNAVTFTVTSPGLTLTSISPNSAIVGSPAFSLTATGTGFTSSAQVTWNGSPLTTTFVSATQLTASVPASLIASTGTASVGVSESGQTSPAPLPFVITPPLTITSVTPSSAGAGGAGFTLTVTGTGFVTGTTVLWNGLALATTIVNVTLMTATVPANLVAGQETVSITAQNGNNVSNSLPFSISAPQNSVTLSSLSPNSAPAGSPDLTLTVYGSGFTSGTNMVTWDGSVLATMFVSGTQLTALVPARLLAAAGTAAVSVTGLSQSSSLPFTITGLQTQTVTLTSISPATVSAGGPGFTLTVNGGGFTNTTTVTWNGNPLPTTFVSSSQLSAAVLSTLITSPATVAIDVSVPAGQTPPAALQLAITSSLTITSLSPTSVTAGGPAFTLTVIGAGFASGATVLWNGSTPLSTTFVSATQLTATVGANLIALAGSSSVTVSSGNLLSNALTFTINPPGPVITSISPATVVAGGPAFTLTVSGTGFVSGAVVSLNGTPLSTNYASSTQVTAAVPATLTAQPGSANITLTNPSGVGSNAVTLTITAPAPVITSISPATVVAGGPAFTLTVVGTGFLAGVTVSFNSTALSTTFVSATQLTAAVPASLIAQILTAQITATNASGAASNAVALTVTPPTPTITSVSPSTVPAGSIAFTMAVTGTNFLAGATVSFNSTALNTTFLSATQLTAVVPANLIMQAGTAQITVANTVGGASNAVSLTITTPAPTITSLSPSSVTAGGPAFTLTVNGTNFVSGATVSLAGTSLATTFVSSTQLTAAVAASAIQQSGMLPVTVTNPNGAASGPSPLTVAPTVPTISGISPASVVAGGPAFTLTVNGSGFLTGAVVFINGTNIATTVVSATQITAQVPPNLIAQPGTLQVTAANQGGAQSGAVTLTVNPAPPTLTSITPVSAKVGDPTFTLSLTGTGFVQASIAQWNGAPLATTFVSSTQLTATIDTGRLILPATASVTVMNPPLPDGTPQVSNAVTFTINPVTPVVSSISPTSVTAGGSAFSLTVNGSGFLTLTTIQWNTTALTTHFVSATQVTADVPASLIAQTGTVTVTAVNPGNNVSTAFTFTINPGAPAVITSLSQSSATAGDAAFTLTVTGTGFVSGAVVNFGSTALTTTYISATQLTAAVTANLLLAPATYQVTVQQGGASSNALTFTVNLPAPPSLRLNAPSTSGPAQQPTIDFGLNAAYPIALSGTVTLTFASNATIPVDDPSIQFASGGRTFTFTVPPNTTTLPALLIQTGTVAGVITLNVTLTAAGVNVTPATGASATITVPKSAPVIRTVTLVRASGYLEVDINAFSTTRDMTTAVFTLNPVAGGSFTTSVFTVPVSSLFNAPTGWYQGAASTAFGSQFTYAQTFTVIGDTNQIQSVTVTLTNSTGTSGPVTSN